MVNSTERWTKSTEPTKRPKDRTTWVRQKQSSCNRYRYGQDEKDELRLWDPKKTVEAKLSSPLPRTKLQVKFSYVTNRQHLTVTPEELAGLHFLSTNVSELNTKHQAYRYCNVKYIGFSQIKI